jgi:chromosome segregation protein
LHLKSLTLRGFKSFASSTTLHFEPGITCVVGPNGSGKSNVVDAIAWVLGEQGAKSLRGGKMEDVIFAGTSARPPLGRAEVILTVDNADGALPLDYTEISLSRLMYRTGESEYSINGTPCRLLDVQELLSDSGIGREMHVIVGQGQLDSILSGRPEDRRAFIEEAAGVLKHRKRKEKALRKLEAMQANLTRLTDLTTELRRQLGPLGRQAEVARRAAVVQADLRDARLRLLADDLTNLTETLRREVADEEEIRARRQGVEAEIAAAAAAEARLEAEIAELTPALALAQETWYRLAAVGDRLRSVGSLAAERGRHLAAAAQAARTGPDPEALEAAARATRAEEAGLQQQVAALREGLAERTAARVAAETALAEEETRLLAAARAAADQREGLARLTGQVAALRSRHTAAEEEIGRLAAAAADAVARADAAQAEYRSLESEIAGLDAGEEGLDARHETAVAGLEAAAARVADLQAQERELDRERSALQARRDALALSLERRDAAATLLADPHRPAELAGALAELLGVQPGYEAAVAAALGPAADSVAVIGAARAISLLERAKADDAGRLTVVVGGEQRTAGPDRPAPEGGRWAVEVVRAPGGFEGAVARLLAGVVVVDDLAAARRAVEADPDVVAVTRDGDLLAVGWAAGGSAGAPSRLEVQAALEETRAALAELGHRGERLRFAVGAATAERDRWQAEVDGTLAELHDSDARLAAVAEKLAQLGGAARAAQAEAERLLRTRADAEANRDRWSGELAELEERLRAVESEGGPAAPAEDRRQERTAIAVAARAAEVDARLALRTAEERSRALADRAESYESAARAERAARQAAVAAAGRRERESVVAAAVSRATQVAVAAVERSLAAAAEARAAAETTRTVREGELLAVRGRLRELGATLDTLTDAVHRDEVLRAEQRARIEGLAAKAVEEYGVDQETLLAEYGPEVPVPVAPSPDAPADARPPQPVPYRREEQEKRARSAERSLALLGKVNPLALEEFAALQERQRFLAEQLEDLRATRRDLLTVVKEVDERVQALFAAAFADTAREFEKVFATLFPGGEGRLALTEPDDLLGSGVEVEARPAGKRVKRLSLLSGGERSLTAIALLVAIFRARPSPFYVLDEVEAALDERNLDRLIRLLEELRGTSQLIVVTHQKRTMEAADSLYGVTMRSDGITEVISQRIREPEPA